MGKSGAQVDANSSLIFRPLIKEQHGVWECTATNVVASVSTTTSVHVLGELLVPSGQMLWVLGCPGVYTTSLPVLEEMEMHLHDCCLSHPI